MNKVLTLLFFVSFNVFAFCPQLYPYGKEVALSVTELCNKTYVIRYDAVNKRNILSAEVLQPTGHQAERLNDFHADTRLPKNKQVSPSLYSNTGFDKGHMVPAGDAVDAATMSETFLMTNMTPQKPTLNRESWRMLEESVRKVAAEAKAPIHVVTGALYEGKTVLMNGIPVPSGYYKIVYVGTTISVYYADNVDKAKVVTGSLSNIEKRAGFLLH